MVDENNSLNIIPLIVYDSALDNRKVAIKDNRNKAGVYRWVHNKSGKFYIGSSTNLGQRFSSYFGLNWLKSQAKFSIIYKSLLKYGHSEFRLEVLEYCNIENTIEREQYYFDNLNPEYNILKVAGSRLGYKVTDSTKAKISSTLFGRTIPKDVRNKMRDAKLGMQHNEATKAKLKEHLTILNKTVLAEKKSLKIIILDLETNITTEYSSIRKAALAIGSYAHKITDHEKLKLTKNYTKPFKGRYEIKINRKED